MDALQILMKILVVTTFTLLNLLGCSDDQQQFDQNFAQQQGQEESEQEQAEDGETNQESNELDDASQSIIEDASENSSELLGNSYQEEGEEGESLNNSTENEFEESNESAEMPAVDQAVDETSAGAAAGSQQMQEATYTPGGRVKYVTSSSTVYSDKGSAPSGQLEQGDHPLVFEEGEWSRTADGQYIDAASLTDAPVGRYELPAVWQ